MLIKLSCALLYLYVHLLKKRLSKYCNHWRERFEIVLRRNVYESLAARWTRRISAHEDAGPSSPAGTSAPRFYFVITPRALTSASSKVVWREGEHLAGNNVTPPDSALPSIRDHSKTNSVSITFHLPFLPLDLHINNLLIYKYISMLFTRLTGPRSISPTIPLTKSRRPGGLPRRKRKKNKSLEPERKNELPALKSNFPLKK